MDGGRENEDVMMKLIAGGEDDGSGEGMEGEDDGEGTLTTKSGEPSGSSQSSRRKRGPTKKLGDHQRFTIDEVAEDGEPIAPVKHVKLFVNQCGVIVRDNIPITTREWNKPKADGVSYVDQRSKDFLWNTLMTHFTLPPEEDEEQKVIEPKVKAWAFKKMAEQFCNFKKKLYKDYIQKKKSPTFTGTLEKIKDHWDAFVEYKESEEFLQRSAKGKANAAKKKYHHVLGTGGYKSAMPKWDQTEKALIAKEITPEPLNWPKRSRNWFYGHGGSLDPQTGKCIYTKEHIAKPLKDIVQAITDVQEGKFHPDRENDELTRALGNDEHTGRTRGKGTVPWRIGFSDCKDSYRSRQRKKKQQADRMQKLEQILVRQQEQIDALCQQATGPSQRQEDPAFDTTDSFQQKSSVASTEIRSDDALMARYPVDGITERENCELHMSVKNISMKVAVGFALPSGPRATYHCSPIPDGYAVVGVDEVLKGFENLELDFPAGEGETELGEVRKTTILWEKQNIVFPHLAPRPPTPQSSNPALSLPPQPSPARLPTPPPQSTQPTPPPQPTPPTKPRVEKRKSSSTASSTSTTAKKSAVSPRKKPPSPPRKRSPPNRRAESPRRPPNPSPRRRADSPIRRRPDLSPGRPRRPGSPRRRSPSPRRHRSPMRRGRGSPSPRRRSPGPLRRSPGPPRRRSPPPRRLRSPPRRPPPPPPRRHSRSPPPRRPLHSRSRSISPRRGRGPPLRRGRSDSSYSASPSPPRKGGPRRVSRSRSPRRPGRGRSGSSDSGSSGSSPTPRRR